MHFAIATEVTHLLLVGIGKNTPRRREGITKSGNIKAAKITFGSFKIKLRNVAEFRMHTLHCPRTANLRKYHVLAP
jgi:hypothetical protein